MYLVHRFDAHTPVEETVEALDSLVRQGKVRYVGFSNWPAWLAATAVGIQNKNGWARFRAAEMYYSLVGRDLEHDVVPFVEHAGIGVLVWSPLAGGFLSGKYTRENPEGRRRTADRLRHAALRSRKRPPGGGPSARHRRRLMARLPAQVALAWLLSKRAVTSILIGANKMAQLEDNLGIGRCATQRRGTSRAERDDRAHARLSKLVQRKGWWMFR